MKPNILTLSLFIILSLALIDQSRARVQATHVFDGLRGVPFGYDLEDPGDLVLHIFTGVGKRIVRGYSTVVTPPENSPPTTLSRSYRGRILGNIINTQFYYRVRITMRSQEGDIIRGVFESFLSKAEPIENIARYRLHVRFHGTTTDGSTLGITKKQFTITRTLILKKVQVSTD